MNAIRIIVDGREYSLPADKDAEVIMGEITDLVRAGGGFVELVRTNHRALNVLVSPGMSLSLEVVPSSGEPDDSTPDAETPEPSWFDPFDLT